MHKIVETLLQKLDQQVGAVSVDASWPVGWNLIMLIGLMFSVLYAPFHVGFLTVYHSSTILTYYWMYQMYLVSSLVYLLDIIVVLNTTFYHKGLEVNTRLAILDNYYKNYLLIDIVSLITPLLLLIVGIGLNPYIFLLDLFRMAKLSKVVKLFSDLFNTSELGNGYF